MKGSAIVLLGCFALLYTAPSHAYSVKFVSEDDQMAKPRSAESGNPSLSDVETLGDAVRWADNDTVTEGNRTVNADDSAKPADQSVREDTPTGESKIRKRDTLGLLRDMTADVRDTEAGALDRDRSLAFLKKIGNRGFKCFRNAVWFLQRYELKPDTEILDNQNAITKQGMITMLKIIRGQMSQCFNDMYEARGEDSDSDPMIFDDDTPPLAKPVYPAPITDAEMVTWLRTIGYSLDRCFNDVIEFLEEKEATDSTKRSPDMINGIVAKFHEIFSGLNGVMRNIGNQKQGGPPDEIPPTYPPLYPPLFPDYDEENLPGRPDPINYPVSSDVPVVIEGEEPPIAVPLPSYIPGMIREENPNLITNIIPKPYLQVMTTHSSNMDDTRKSSSYFSLLDLVLNQIYDRIQAKMPPIGTNEAPSEQSLRAEIKDILSLTGNPKYRQNRPLANAGNPVVVTDLNTCIDACMRGVPKRRAA